MMRALHIMASGARGGGASHLIELLPALEAQGIETAALVGDDGPLAHMLRERDVDTDARALMGRRLDPGLGHALWAYARHVGANIVHVHGTRAAALWTLGRPFARSGDPFKVLYHAHGLACSQAPARSLRWRLRLAGEALACLGKDAVLSCSAADLALLRRQRLVPAGEGHLVPNATAAAAGARPLSHARRRKLRRAAGLPEEGLIVATVARLVPQKDVATLASAVLPLAGLSLAVMGTGPLLPALRAHPLMQAGRLFLLGARDDVPALLPACDLFALSSRWEGEPIALLEAMAQGLPWVATHTDGAAQLGALGCGLLTPVGKVAALSRTLAHLAERPRWREALGAAGMRAAAGRTVAHQAARIADIYRATLDA